MEWILRVHYKGNRRGMESDTKGCLEESCVSNEEDLGGEKVGCVWLWVGWAAPEFGMFKDWDIQGKNV